MVSEHVKTVEAMLTESVEEVIERERTALSRVLGPVNNRVVLFGAGSNGRRGLGCLRSIGIEPLAFSDSNNRLWGQVIDGLPVFSPEEAATQFGSDAAFIVTIWRIDHWYTQALTKLRSLGCLHVHPAGPLLWRFPETFLPFFSQDLPHKVTEQSEQVGRAAAIWSDEESRRQYTEHVRWRLFGDLTGLPETLASPSYVVPDLFLFSNSEILIDCGAFTGDTIQLILSIKKDNFGAIHALEPDPANFAALQDYVSTLEPSVQQRITLHPYGAGASRGTVRFQGDGGIDAKATPDGGHEVNIFSIDDLFQETSPTLIKMDIEGAEYEALRGARQTIRQHMPILAICVYHYQFDLWRLPLFIHDLAPEYKLHLRTHEGDGWQTVAYAVPPHRVTT